MAAGATGARYFDPERETLDRERLAQYQLERLRALLREVLPANRFYAERLGLPDADAVRSWDDFRALPFTRKADLADDQAGHPPYGTNLTYPLERYTRLHQTSGTSGKAPIRWLDTPETWAWWARCWGHVYCAAGVGPGDRVFFAFSFGPFVGFWSAFEGAQAVSALALPGGGMTTEQRVQALLDNRASALVCTPTYALRLAEVAAALGVDLAPSAVRATIHAGEPGASIPTVRDRIQAAYGARAYDHTGLTEVGATGFTCQEQSGVHLLESEFIFEVVEPASGAPVAPGERGELIVTNLGRGAMPLIRYRTGDLVEVDAERCGCGRTFARLRGGILGRADEMLVVRGVNLFPSAIEGVVREFPDVAEFRVEVTQVRHMHEVRLLLEPVDGLSADAAEHLARQVADTLSRRLLLRIPCEPVPPGTLPRFELKARRVVRAITDPGSDPE